MTAQTAAPLRIPAQPGHEYRVHNWPPRNARATIPGITRYYAAANTPVAGPDVLSDRLGHEDGNFLSRLLRHQLHHVLGFDFGGTWRRRAEILSAGVIWTHTEAQARAVLLLYLLTPLRFHPPLIAQCDWLGDRWALEPSWRRAILRSLLSRADVLTFVSAEDMAYARALFPGQRMEWVGSAAPLPEPPHQPPRTPQTPLRILSLGHDPRRDWTAVLDAVALLPPDMACHVHVATLWRRAVPAHVRAFPRQPSLFDQADIVVVPLTEKLHAADLAVIEEASRHGLPVIATNTGGLRHYLDAQCVFYVPPGDPPALGQAIATLAGDPERRAAMVRHARARIRSFPVSFTHTLRHVALSRELLARGETAQAASSVAAIPAARDLKITVGIATSGRPAILRETIAELRRQSHAPRRIIVCAPTPADVAGLSPAPDLEILQGPRGLAHQRNVILDHVDQADVILFFDDDFLPDRDYLAVCANAFASAADIVGTTGRVLADGAKGPGLTVDGARRMLADPRINNTTTQPALQPAWNGYGCNMAYRLSVIREAGLRFDERLPLYAWYEDIDFSRQMGRLGRIVRANGAKGIHLGSKLGRTPGRRLGYSQVANPLYLSRKGTFPLDHALRSIGRNIAMNALRSLWSEPYIDRRGRIVGNWLALRDALRGSLSPEKILTL
ncbi:glycosyltransferase [Komagataeibacter sp. FNDCR2]|uniref:glycosyltransferase n=1 Tax=Komagataeibacter sp. FNDCR2 TaxID=2878682 RepID=UPI001E409C7E|nr:glycosyltransferase [Komagataeibacter sp. FNDCR2]MCE2574200.1 glycosyltransferase [Komagataeibacter sp. FNDCR2]